MKRGFLLTLVGMTALAAVGTGCAYTAAALFGGIGGAPQAALAVAVNPALIKHGQYVATAGDCDACHTAPGGDRFAGGVAIATPVGTVYATNITPDDTTGIGHYSYGDFERAVRRGIRPDGSSLYPAMPFPSYARINDEDLQALFAYIRFSVPAVEHLDRPTSIAWPMSARWPLTYWRWLFAPQVRANTFSAVNDPLRSRGAYLVESLGHCGACHTPRAFTLQEKALTDADGPAYLAGAVVDNYVANDLRGDVVTGLGSWSESDIVTFLQTGRNAQAAAFGGMSDVIQHSTQYMVADDLGAIAHYLKTLSAHRSDQFIHSAASGAALAAGDVSARGALDYLNNCAACHLSSGRGYSSTFPALADNPVVNAPDPASLISIVLRGAAEPATGSVPTRFTMPSFADRLDDQEIADVLSFLRSHWGNHAPGVVPGAVAKIRVMVNIQATAYRAGDVEVGSAGARATPPATR